MNRRNALVALSISLLLALVIAQPVFGSPNPVHTSATLGVSLSFSPNPVDQNTQTTGSYSITGGTGPYTIWENNTPAGCYPQSNPFTTPNPSGTFNCKPTVTGNFNIHVDVQDSAGNSGSTQVTLTVNSGGSGSGGSGSGSGNNSGGFNLSGLSDLLGVFMIVGFVFLGSMIAIAAAAVALAILVPRRLKQLRKAIEGQPMTKIPGPATPLAPPNDEPPKIDL